MIVYARGTVRITCDQQGCPWMSKRAPDMSEARLELAQHNYENHPGVFPRWNLKMRAVESRRGMRKHEREGTSAPADPEAGTGLAEGGG